jgi:acetyl esterase/lipase
MNVIDINLNVDYKKAGVVEPGCPCRFTGYILRQYLTGCPVKRPAVIILPGGAYRHISAREAMPVATEYLAKGFSTFVLSYTVSPNGFFPCAMLETFTAVSHVRRNADSYGIDPNKIFVCGFSAGGHAAASAGVLWNHPITRNMGFTGSEHRPDAMVLCYPVITSGNFAHRESFVNLLGKSLDEETLELVSLEKHVNQDTPKTFIWHTASDESVPVQNTLLLVNALIQNKIETEVHIYPRGEHGLSTARDDVLTPDRFTDDPYVKMSVTNWISDSIRFLKFL